MDVLAKLGLGFWAVYCVLSGPQLGPSQPAQLGPTLDRVWIRGLNWACFSGLFTEYSSIVLKKADDYSWHGNTPGP